MAVNKDKPAKKDTAGSKGKRSKSDLAAKQLKIRLVRSVIGRPSAQREVVRGLGLRKINSEVIREDRPEIRGMIRKIPHLIKVEELEKK